MSKNELPYRFKNYWSLQKQLPTAKPTNHKIEKLSPEWQHFIKVVRDAASKST